MVDMGARLERVGFPNESGARAPWAAEDMFGLISKRCAISCYIQVVNERENCI